MKHVCGQQQQQQQKTGPSVNIFLPQQNHRSTMLGRGWGSPYHVTYVMRIHWVASAAQLVYPSPHYGNPSIPASGTPCNNPAHTHTHTHRHTYAHTYTYPHTRTNMEAITHTHTHCYGHLEVYIRYIPHAFVKKLLLDRISASRSHS